MTILENIPLQPYTTFGVQSIASYFVEVESIEDVKSSLLFAREHQLSHLVLGGGSNVLFTKDYKGLIIKMSFKGISYKKIDDTSIRVSAKAGENWHEFVRYCVKNDFGGLENLALIPGNVGTSPIQNIGAYGVEIKDRFESCTVLNLATLEKETITNEECRFGYRNSIFKQEGKGNYIILEVTFILSINKHQLNQSYGAISTKLQKAGITSPTIKDIFETVCEIRSEKLPDPNEIGNAGSFFKNPIITSHQFENLLNDYSSIPNYVVEDGIKIPAGWLIEQCGWKGKQLGNVATHSNQALVIINKTGNATGKEIYEFSSLIINSVKDKYGITLEREVNII